MKKHPISGHSAGRMVKGEWPDREVYGNSSGHSLQRWSTEMHLVHTTLKLYFKYKSILVYNANNVQTVQLERI